MEKYRALYDSDPRFRRYVDDCVKADGISVDEELAKKIIQNVGDYYERTPMNETEKAATSTMIGGGC